MRHYLGIGPDGPNVFRYVRKDMTGEPLLFVDENAVTALRVNFSDWLEGTETIASYTLSAEDCTVTASLASPNLDLTVSDVMSFKGGKATIVATSSNGEAWRGIIRIRRASRYGDEYKWRDYT